MNTIVSFMGTVFLLIFALVAFMYVRDKVRPVPAQTAQTSPIVVPALSPRQIQLLTPEYIDCVSVVIECLASNYASCGLCRPGPLPQHMAPDGNGIITDAKCGILFLVFFDRAASLDGGIGNTSYTTTSLKSMVKKINSVLPNYCIAKGLVPYIVVRGKNYPAGRVCLGLAPIGGC